VGFTARRLLAAAIVVAVVGALGCADPTRHDSTKTSTTQETSATQDTTAQVEAAQRVEAERQAQQAAAEAAKAKALGDYLATAAQAEKDRQTAVYLDAVAREQERQRARSPAPSCPNGTYVNSAGNEVCSPYQSPSGPPAGATARCSDGTYSFSQSRSGTCSSHGGVAQWL
jgi:hypothetical protein